MNKEEINNVVCESSSDYEILDNAYNYIETLEQENKQLKDNFDELKKLIKWKRKVSSAIRNDYGVSICYDLNNKMQELEKGEMK